MKVKRFVNIRSDRVCDSSTREWELFFVHIEFNWSGNIRGFCFDELIGNIEVKRSTTSVIDFIDISSFGIKLSRTVTGLNTISQTRYVALYYKFSSCFGFLHQCSDVLSNERTTASDISHTSEHYCNYYIFYRQVPFCIALIYTNTNIEGVYWNESRLCITYFFRTDRRRRDTSFCVS